jgi:hypothetical protein
MALFIMKNTLGKIVAGVGFALCVALGGCSDKKPSEPLESVFARTNPAAQTESAYSPSEHGRENFYELGKRTNNTRLNDAIEEVHRRGEIDGFGVLSAKKDSAGSNLFFSCDYLVNIGKENIPIEVYTSRLGSRYGNNLYAILFRIGQEKIDNEKGILINVLAEPSDSTCITKLGRASPYVWANFDDSENCLLVEGELAEKCEKIAIALAEGVLDSWRDEKKVMPLSEYESLKEVTLSGNLVIDSNPQKARELQKVIDPYFERIIEK